MQWGSGSIDELADAVDAQGADTLLVRRICSFFCLLN